MKRAEVWGTIFPKKSYRAPKSMLGGMIVFVFCLR